MQDLWQSVADSFAAIHIITPSLGVYVALILSVGLLLCSAFVSASETAFFNASVDQRAFELAGEMLRKADLIRWNLLSSKLAEAKQKMIDLRTRTGAYADLPKKIYYTYEEDGETLKFYGLNHGDTDEAGAMLTGWDSTDWITETKLEDKTLNAL